MPRAGAVGGGVPRDSGQIVVNTQHVPYSVATLGRSSRAATREHHHQHTATRRSRSAHSLNRTRQERELRPYVEQQRSSSPSRPGTFGATQGRLIQEHLARSGHDLRDDAAFSSRDGNWITVNEAKVKKDMSTTTSLSVRNEAKAKQMSASMQEELRREARRPPPSPSSSGYGTSQGGMSTPSRVVATPSGMARAKSPGGSLPNGGVVYRVEPVGPASPQPRMVHKQQTRPTGRFVFHHPPHVLRNRQPSPQFRVMSPGNRQRVAPAHALAIARAQSPGGYGMTLHRQTSPQRKQGPQQVVVQRGGPPKAIYITADGPASQQYHVIRDPGHPQGRYVRSRRGSSSSSSSGSKYRNPLLREKQPPPACGIPLGARNRSSSVPDIFLELKAEDNFFPQTLPRNFGAQPSSVSPQVYHSSTVPRRNKHLVYRGEFVKVAVPRYRVEEDKAWVATNNNRNSLLISKTYHSEPNLLEAQEEEYDDDGEISMRLSLLPPEESQTPVTPGHLRMQVPPQSRQMQGPAARTPQTLGVTYFNTPNTPGTPISPRTPVTPATASAFSFSSPDWWVLHQCNLLLLVVQV